MNEFRLVKTEIESKSEYNNCKIESLEAEARVKNQQITEYEEKLTKIKDELDENIIQSKDSKKIVSEFSFKNEALQS